MRFAVRRALCLDEQSGYFLAGGRRQRQEDERAVFLFANVHSIERQNMSVHVQSQSRIGSLNCGHRAGVSVRNAVETEQALGPPFERAAELQDEGCNHVGAQHAVVSAQRGSPYTPRRGQERSTLAAERSCSATCCAPPLAQERVESLQGGLVRIVLKRAYADGTQAVEMDPLSLLCRLATSVPPPRYHTVKFAGVLAPARPPANHARAANPCRCGRSDRAKPNTQACGRRLSPMG